MNFRFYISIHIYYRDELFNSLESREDFIYLSNRSSYTIKDVKTIDLKVDDGTTRKLDEIRYIPSFRKNLISHSKLDSNGYTWKVDDRILKIMDGSRVIL